MRSNRRAPRLAAAALAGLAVLAAPGPAAAAAAGSATPAPLPPDLPQGQVTLPVAVDFALRNNPVTRSAWLRMKAAEEGIGIREGAWYPSLIADVTVSRSQVVAQGGASTSRLTTWGPSALLSWLALDLGGRSADVAEARALAAAAAKASDATIQAVIYGVTQAYLGYAASRELATAAEVTLKEAETNLAAAEARHTAGLATIADVLQARTARSQADLAVEVSRGAVETARGSLATVLGVPATIPVDTAPLPAKVDLSGSGESVETLVERAVASRPDLAAVRQQAAAAQQRVKSVRSSGLPSLVAQASAGRPFFLDSPYAALGDNWSIGLDLRIPIFTGFSWTHQVEKAKREAEAAASDAGSASQQVVLDVWTGLQAVRTARGQLRTTRDLLESAQQSTDAALARYKAGVGGLIDLLTAEAALASARAQDIQARATALLSLAQLARATGTLAPPSEAPAPTR